MQKTLPVAAVLLIVGMLLLGGCGEETVPPVHTDAENGDVIDLTEPVSEGIVGAFHQEMGLSGEGGARVEFKADGTFEGDAWGRTRTGTYEVTESESGDSVVLNFDDGTTERWSVAITAGEVSAVVDKNGEQYIKKPEE